MLTLMNFAAGLAAAGWLGYRWGLHRRRCCVRSVAERNQSLHAHNQELHRIISAYQEQSDVQKERIDNLEQLVASNQKLQQMIDQLERQGYFDGEEWKFRGDDDE